MPIVLRVGPYAFGFFASDQSEPPHVHVSSQGRTAKFWLEPTVSLQRAGRFRRHELAKIEKVIAENRAELLEAWHDFFRR
jgi:hypothetical protein